MILGFGEIMMRVAPSGFARFRQCLPGSVDVTFGGGEANVCGSLALLGRPVRYLTALPDHATVIDPEPHFAAELSLPAERDAPLA